MTEKIRQPLKHGIWLYGGTVQSDVWIVRQNYFERPAIVDDLADPVYPPRDAEGCFHFPEWRIPGAGAGSGGGVFASVEEAIRWAERVAQGGIEWD